MRAPVVATSIDGKGPGLFAWMADSELWLWRLMLAPAILYILLLVGFPFFLSLFYSVSNATVGSTNISFTGLENFQRVIESHTFWVALENTIVFTIISQILVLVFANVLAMALLADFRGKWLIRLLILLPWVAPISLGSVGWLWIFDSIYSVINWGDSPARSSSMADLAWHARSCHGLDHHGPSLANAAAGDRHYSGRAVLDPAGYP